MNCKISTGIYDESFLVDAICSEAQRRSYHIKNKFAGGKYQELFLNKLSKICEYDYCPYSKKYNIIKVFEHERTLADGRCKKGVYQHFTPMILQYILSNWSSGNIIDTPLRIAKLLGLIGENYIVVKCNSDMIQDKTGIRFNIQSEYFNKLNSSIDTYIRRCVKYLQSMNCLNYEESYMVSALPKTAKVENGYVVIGEEEIRRATEEEIEHYLLAIEIAEQEMEITHEQEKWYGKKAHGYRTMLDKLLREHNMSFICRALEFTDINSDRCKEVLDWFSDKPIKQRQAELRIMIKNIMDKNAKKRADSKSYGDEYVDQFERLSTITLLNEPDDLFKFILSAQPNDYQETMNEKYELKFKFVRRRKRKKISKSKLGENSIVNT